MDLCCRYAGMVGILLLVGCNAVEVRTTYQPAAKFDKLTTYQWAAGTGAPSSDPRIDNSELDPQVRSAVDSELRQKGYRKTNDGQSDFVVTYHAGIESKVVVQSIGPYGGRPGVGGYYRGRGGVVIGPGDLPTQTYATEYEQGTLILDVIDRPSGKPIWRGTAQAAVSSSLGAQKRKDRVRDAIHRMLEEFPP